MYPVERQRRAQELFLEALDLTGGAREPFLQRACAGDASLRTEIERLLEADARKSGMLGTGVPSPGDLLRRAHLDQRVLAEISDSGAGGRSAMPDALPRTIGRYEILRKLDRGGMGIVYLAQQQNPQRTVALKVVQPGVASPRTLRRFEHEAQVLGRLQHPGIAQIYEAGTFDRGDGPEPFFAMEFIEGEPLTEYAAKRVLDVRGRLELLVKLCQAVHYAHQKGVIHRDLKPGNVLVDAAGQPKILDFGVARLADESEARAALTLTGQLVGTLPYMSPEQYSGDAHQVDTRSDVYALGVIAYELLAGQLPHALADQPVHEAARIVCEQRPRPLGALDRRLRGDIELVVAKAIETDKERRYASALDFAADIERFLRNEPILARPPSTVYQLRKFARRNRTLVASAGTLVLMLAIGLGVTSVLYTEARRKADQILRLSASRNIEELEQAADQLWPPSLELVPKYEQWLERADALVSMLPTLEDARQTLLRRATYLQNDTVRPSQNADWIPSVIQEQRRNYLDELEMRLAQLDVLVRDIEHGAAFPNGTPGNLSAARVMLMHQILPVRQRIDVLMLSAHNRASYTFANTQDGWWYEQTCNLIASIQAFADVDTGLIDGQSPERFWGIRKRLQATLDAAENTLNGAEAMRRWSEAIESIGDPQQCPGYAGLQIRVQYGMLPLRRDPRSNLWEFAHLLSGIPPTLRKTDDSWDVNPQTCLVFVLIPHGAFYLDSGQPSPADAPTSGMASEGKQKAIPIELDAFFVSKYEMTQAQWLRLAGTNPSVLWAGNQHCTTVITPTHPVDNVTGVESLRVVQRFGLDLPTEAQWQYAAWGGESWWASAGATSLDGYGNFLDAAAKAGGYEWTAFDEWLDDGYAGHAPVDCYRPNPFGLHNVFGNVHEWIRTVMEPGVADEHGSYREGALSGARDKTLCGGCYFNRASDVAKAGLIVGGRLLQTTTDSVLGLRPIRRLDK